MLFKEVKKMSQVETVTTPADKAKLLGATALVIAGLAGYFTLSKSGAAAQWGVLLAGLAAAAVLFFMTQAGKSLIDFFRVSYEELKKVVWPERKEAMQVTGYVFAFVVVMAIIMLLTDKTIEWLLYDVILGWK